MFRFFQFWRYFLIRWRKYLSILKSYLNGDSWRNIEKCDVLLVCHENDRGYKLSGKWYSPLLDSIAWHLNDLSYSRITKGISQLKSVNTFGEPKLYSRYLINSKIKSIFLKAFRSDYYYLSQVRLWKEILLKSEASIVIAIQPDEALCHAGKIMNVLVCDYQHGVITDSMPYYGSEFQVTKKSEALPHVYLCWDQPSCDVLNKWTVAKNIPAYNVGHSWLDRFCNVNQLDELVKSELLLIRNMNSNSKCNVLVTLQWGLSEFYPEFFSDDEFIHNSLVNVIKKCSRDYNWYIRLHPVHVKNEAVKRKICDFFSKIDNVDTEIATSASLPALLSQMHGHITWDSSSVIEATNFAIPSFVMNPGKFSSLQTPTELRGEILIEEGLPYSSKLYSKFVERSSNSIEELTLSNWLQELNFTSASDFNKSSFNKAVMMKLISNAQSIKKGDI